MFVGYDLDEAGDPTIERWQFCNEDDPCEGDGWLEVSIHEIITTQYSGTLAVYYRQWFAPDGKPAWGNRRKRVIGSIGSLTALMRRRKMTAQGIEVAKPARRDSGSTSGESPTSQSEDAPKKPIV